MATSPYNAESEATAQQHNNTVFRTLSDPRRRFSLRYLRVADTPIKVSDLASEIHSWESAQVDLERADGNASDIEVSLVHNHLPQMEAAGYIDYDSEQGTVARNDQADDLRAHLKICGAH